LSPGTAMCPSICAAGSILMLRLEAAAA
jgi:hypothetical protein